MIETAKANDLAPCDYLLFLLHELPELGETPDENQLREYRPCLQQFRHIAAESEEKSHGKDTFKTKKNRLL